MNEMRKFKMRQRVRHDRHALARASGSYSTTPGNLPHLGRRKLFFKLRQAELPASSTIIQEF